MGAATFAAGAGADGRPGTHAQGITHDGFRFVQGTLTMSASYATGGDTLNLATIPGGVKRLVRIEIPLVFGSVFHGGCGFTIQFGGTATAPLLKAIAGITTAAAIEVANTTNLSTRPIVGAKLVFAGA